MSQPQIPIQTTPAERERYINIAHNTALLTLIAFPALALLPPRKIDIYTFGLVGGTLFSANYLYRERYGRSILDRVSEVTSHETITPVQKPVENFNALKQSRVEPTITETIQTKSLQSGKDKAWVAERQEEVKEALEEGKGFGEMMMDQIWDVVNWSKKKD